MANKPHPLSQKDPRNSQTLKMRLVLSISGRSERKQERQKSEREDTPKIARLPLVGGAHEP